MCWPKAYINSVLCAIGVYFVYPINIFYFKNASEANPCVIVTYLGDAHYIYLCMCGPTTYINSVPCAIGVYFVNPIIARILSAAKTSIFIAQGIPVMLLPTIDQKVAQMKRFEAKMYYSFGWGSKLRK